MLDIRFIREHPDIVKAAITQKKVALDLDELLDADAKRRDLLAEVEGLRSAKNTTSSLLPQLSGSDKQAKLLEMKEVDKRQREIEPRLKETEEQYEQLMLQVPNIPSSDTPVGPDESGNVVLRQVGQIHQFDFPPKEHWELGEALGVLDSKKAADVAGSRFAYLKGPLAMMEFALIQLVLHTLTSSEKLAKIISGQGLKTTAKPFIPIVPPVMIRPEVFQRMGRLEPREERYHIPSDNLYLIGSAEHTLGPLHMDEVIPARRLPIRYLGFSTSFRREAGTYGKDMKGVLRVHQFDKLEMESFCLPEDSLAEQNFFVAIQEYLLQLLELPYQVVQICTGDMGSPDHRQVDIECWLPGQHRFRETHTADLMTDFQSRRLNIKYKRAEGETGLVHMNDATAFAIGRTLIAIMENYQEADGSIGIPDVLQGYMGLKKMETGLTRLA